jgi:hypothetical protein
MGVEDSQLCGVTEISTGLWIHYIVEWSTPTNCYQITLKEVCYHREVIDNTVCILFDEQYSKRAPRVFIDSFGYESNISTRNVTICIAHYNGSIQKITLNRSDESNSFLSPLVALSEGNYCCIYTIFL